MDALLSLIKEKVLLDDLQIDEVDAEHTRSGKPVSQILLDMGLMDMPTQLSVIADQLGTEVVEPSKGDISKETIEALPADIARTHQCIPVNLFGDTLQVAFANPLNPEAVDAVSHAVGKDVMAVVADPTVIAKLIDELYQPLSDSFSDILKEMGADADLKDLVDPAKALPDLTQMADATPIIKFVNLVLFQAVQDRASDIHFEPFEDEFKIRYRVDGALYEMAPPPKHLALPVTSRLKVMANLNISERRLPQDGRIAISLGGRHVDLRVLDQSAMKLELESLGLPKHVYDYTIEAIQQPNGIYIITGPTGCGKTTS